MKFDVRTNFPEVNRWLGDLQKQQRFAAAVALTRTAQDVRSQERSEMQRVFDRPVAYTLNSLFLRPASRNNLSAEVGLKDDRAGSGTSATRYLTPQIQGGNRSAKSFERILQRAGLLPAGMLAVPASGIKLNASGSVPRATMVQILSQLRLQLTSGYESRATGSKRSKRTIRRQGVEYFVLPMRRGKLLPGIYGRYTFAAGSAVRPMFIFTDRLKYKKRFDFFGVGLRVINQSFVGHYERELAKAIRTVRPAGPIA